MALKGALFIMVILLLFGTGSNPKGEKFEKTVSVCEKDTATLICGTNGQKASYQWRFASRKRVPNKTDKYEQLQNGAKLLVKNVQDSDIAKIKYISCNTHSEDMRRIVYLYKIVINCENFKTPVGSSARLPCKVNIPDDELDFIKWTFIFKRQSKNEIIKLFRKDGKATLASSLRFRGRITAQNKTLIIHNIKMEDIGTYHCAAYRKKNFHLGNPRYHYNVNVTARTTRKPIAMDTAASTKTISLGPNIGYTVEPAKTVIITATSHPQFTTPTRKTVHISTGGPMVQTNTRSTVSTMQMPRPTTAPLPNTELNKKTNKLKDLLSTTTENVNLNNTQKHDRTSIGCTRSTPSMWLFIFLFSNLVNSQLSYA